MVSTLVLIYLGRPLLGHTKKINHSFAIKPFFYITQKLGQKSKYLKSEKSFQNEIKSNFYHF